MSITKIVAKEFIIPLNSAANVPIAFTFNHPSESTADNIVAMGVVENSNPNLINYRIGLNVNEGQPTLDPISKNFYVVSAAAPLNDRYTNVKFSKPSNLKSGIVLVPLTASGAADIRVEIVFKYEAQA
jgi:hypothetical protein